MTPWSTTPGAAAFPWRWRRWCCLALLPTTAAAQGDATSPDVPTDAYHAAPVQALGAEGVFDDTLCDDGLC